MCPATWGLVNFRCRQVDNQEYPSQESAPWFHHGPSDTASSTHTHRASSPTVIKLWIFMALKSLTTVKRLLTDQWSKLNSNQTQWIGGIFSHACPCCLSVPVQISSWTHGFSPIWSTMLSHANVSCWLPQLGFKTIKCWDVDCLLQSRQRYQIL